MEMKSTEVFEHSARGITSTQALEYLIEECAELIVAAQHLKRERISKQELLKEVVDVENMIGQVKEFKDLFNSGIYKKIKEYELVRLYNR